MRTDHEYIELANRGDASGFEGLYVRYRDWVYSLAWRFTGDHADSLDVVQEVFAYLLEKFPGFELRAKMTTFLYPVVKHTALTVRRKKTAGADMDELLEGMAAPMDAARAEGGNEELARMVRGLPAKQREALLLRFVDDLSLEEIAEALGIPVGTVKSRLHGALAKLRESPGMRRYFCG